MTREETASDDPEQDEFTETLHHTVQSFALFGEPPDITQWLQQQLLSCAGGGDVKHLRETFKYKKKFRLRMDWTNSAGESAIIRAWKCKRHEVVKRLKLRGASTFRINVLEAIQEHKNLYCKLMIQDRPIYELLLPELELSIIHDATEVTDVILKRRNIVEELKQGWTRATAKMWGNIMIMDTSYDKSKIAAMFVDTLAAYFVHCGGYGDTNTRRQLVHLGLKCCFPKFAVSMLQKRNLGSINFLMEDLAALHWGFCPWAFDMLKQLYERDILQPHSLAHPESGKKKSKCLFNRRDSVAKRSMFIDSCCSPLREALKYGNPDMLKLILRYGDIDILTIFDKLSRQLQHQMIPYHLTTCVVEQCWEFVINSFHSRTAASIMIQLLEHGFIPDICFANEINILGILIQNRGQNGHKWYRNLIRIIIGGCWRPGNIYTKTAMPNGTAFIDSIVSSALTYMKPVLPMLMDAGLDIRDLSVVVSTTERNQLNQYRRLRKVQSLGASCRVTIRRRISCRGCRVRSMYHAVSTMPIPHLLQKFILLQDKF